MAMAMAHAAVPSTPPCGALHAGSLPAGSVCCIKEDVMTQSLQARHALAQANLARQLSKFVPLAQAARLQLDTLLRHGARVVHAGPDRVVLERAGKRVTVDQHGRVEWGPARPQVASARPRAGDRGRVARA
jgi:hypothetical protein